MSRPVYIEWVDSINHGSGRWGPASEYTKNQTHEGMRHESVGWVLCEDKTSLTIYGSRGVEEQADPNISSVTQIPKVAIVRRTDLAETPKKGKP